MPNAKQEKGQNMTTMPEYTFPNTLTNPTSPASTQLLNHARMAQLIHHRNKNQHRRSTWFRHFSMFRRDLLKLCRDDLGLSLLPSPITNSNSTATTNTTAVAAAVTARGAYNQHRHKQTTAKSRSQGKATLKLKSAMKKDAQARIQHWIDQDRPQRWYTAFTSLAATAPSFAPLSLTLTALLARVCALLGVTAHINSLGEFNNNGDDGGDGGGANSKVDALSHGTSVRNKLTREQKEAFKAYANHENGDEDEDEDDDDEEEDLGEVVQREDLNLHPSSQMIS